VPIFLSTKAASYKVLRVDFEFGIDKASLREVILPSAGFMIFQKFPATWLFLR